MAANIRILNSTGILWLVLSAVWLVTIARYATGGAVYGEFIHATGEWSVRLMMVAMAATPLRLLFPGRGWTAWLLKHRRHFGVASFAFAVPHLAAYVLRLDGPRIASEAIEPGMLTGWIAFLIFLALAVTSNDTFVRKLGRQWKLLHRFVYVAAILTFAHWILTAYDPAAGIAHLIVLAALEMFRVWRVRDSKPGQ